MRPGRWTVLLAAFAAAGCISAQTSGGTVVPLPIPFLFGGGASRTPSDAELRHHPLYAPPEPYETDPQLEARILEAVRSQAEHPEEYRAVVLVEPWVEHDRLLRPDYRTRRVAAAMIWPSGLCSYQGFVIRERHDRITVADIGYHVDVRCRDLTR